MAGATSGASQVAPKSQPLLSNYPPEASDDPEAPSPSAAPLARGAAAAPSRAGPRPRAANEHDSSSGDEYDEHVHYSHRSPWLRAFVLGANDGLVSISALMLGIGGGSADLALMRLSGALINVVLDAG